MDFGSNRDEREFLGPNRTRWIRFCEQILQKYVKILASRQNREFSIIVDIFDTKLDLELEAVDQNSLSIASKTRQTTRI